MKKLTILLFLLPVLAFAQTKIKVDQGDTSSNGFATQKSLIPYLTKAQVLLLNKISRTHMIDFMGDSMTAAGIYPAAVISGLPSGWTAANFGISGDNTQGMLNRIASVTSGAPEYVIILGGVNDLTGGVYTASQTIANLQAIVTAAHNTGSKVVLLTILPFGNNVSWTSGIQTNLNTVNTAIKTTITNVDYVIDTYAKMGQTGSGQNLATSYDSGDGKHPNTTGYNRMAALIDSVVTFTQSSSAVTLSLAKNSTIDQDVSTGASVNYFGVTTTNLKVVNDIAGSIPAPVAPWAFVQLMAATQGSQAFDGTNNLPAYADGSTWHHLGLQEVTNGGASTTNSITVAGLLAGSGSGGYTGGIVNNANITGSSGYGTNTVGAIQSGVSTAVEYSAISNIASGGAPTNLMYYRGDQGTWTGTAPVNQYLYYVPSGFTGASGTNIGFRSDLNSGSGRYAIDAEGTAQSKFNGVVNLFNSGIGTTPTDELTVNNTTAAALGAQQYAPGINFESFGWGTTAGTSQAVNARLYVVPIQGATASGAFNIDWSLNGGAYSTKTQFFSSGSATIGGGTGTISAGIYSGNVSSLATTLTDALVTLNSTAATSGVPLQNSGSVRTGGRLWNSGGTPASNEFDWITYATGASSATPTTSYIIASSLVTSTTPSYTTRATLAGDGTFTVTNLVASAGYATFGTTTSNEYVPNAFSGASTAVSQYQVQGGTSNAFKVGVYGGTITTLTSGQTYTGLVVGNQLVGTFTSGAQPLIASAAFKPPTITINSSGTVTDATPWISYNGTGGVVNWNGWEKGGIHRMSSTQIDTLTASTGVGTDANKRLISISVPITQATSDLTAQTTAVTITTFTVGASTATFNISAYLNVTAVTLDVIQVQVTYTDENSNAQTVSFTTLNSISDSNYNPITIRAKNGTVITVKTNLTTGTGSVTYDAGARINQL